MNSLTTLPMQQTSRLVEELSSWLLLPPGNKAILRFPADSIPQGARLATSTDLLAANLGRPFPWGSLPNSDKASQLWKKHRIGFGGLIHDRWFITSDGRCGGAPNVQERIPGSLRQCLMFDGGHGQEAENEGYAVIKDVPHENRQLYRRVQLHAAEHVVADSGAIILSPLGINREVHVGFVGRCQSCPNPELISFRQLQAAVPGYRFVLLPEWKNWELEPENSLDALQIVQ